MKHLVSLLIYILILSGTLQSKEFWERVNVPNDSPTRELAIDSSGNLYTCYFGMYKSTNGGNSWQIIDEISFLGRKIKMSQTNIVLSSIAVAKNGYLFASMMDGGIFRSKDDGITWEPLLNQELQNLHSFVSCDNGRIFVNGAFDLFYSNDYGDTWTRFSGWPDTNLSSFAKKRMALSPSGKLFASKKGIWVIDTGTLAYNYYTEGIDSIWARCFAFGNGKVFAGSDESGIYISSDNGVTWSNLPNSPRTVPITSMAYTKNGKLIAGSERGGLFFSTDDGQSWTESDAWFASYNINDIDIYNDKIYVSTNGIFTSTDDGITWEPLKSNPGYPLVGFYDMNSKGKLFAFTELGLYTSTDNGTSWNFNQMKEIDKENLFGILLSKSDRMFIWSAWSNYFMYSDDDGETWNSVKSFDKSSTFSLKENSIGHLIVTIRGLAGTNMYISLDYGNNWNFFRENIGSYIFGIGENDELIYTEAITVYFSSDYGDNWTPKTCSDLLGRYGRVNFEMDGDFIWISHSQDGILMSSDRGDTWKEINEGLKDSTYTGEFQVNSLNKIGNTLYTGLAYGLFTYDFDNRTWVLSDSGIVPCAVGQVELLKDKHIYAITSTGVYRTADTITSVEEKQMQNGGTDLSAYPNPFTNKLVIKVTGNNKAETIIVSDILGRTVFSMLSEFLDIGKTYNLAVTTDEFPPGVYYVRMQGTTQSKIVMKAE